MDDDNSLYPYLVRYKNRTTRHLDILSARLQVWLEPGSTIDRNPEWAMLADTPDTRLLNALGATKWTMTNGAPAADSR